MDIHLASHVIPYLWRPQYFVWPEQTECSIQLLWSGDDDELEQTCSLSYLPPSTNALIPSRTPHKREGVRSLITVYDD